MNLEKFQKIKRFTNNKLAQNKQNQTILIILLLPILPLLPILSVLNKNVVYFNVFHFKNVTLTFNCVVLIFTVGFKAI